MTDPLIKIKEKDEYNLVIDDLIVKLEVKILQIKSAIGLLQGMKKK